MVSSRTVSIQDVRRLGTQVIRVGPRVYEKLNELRQTKYGNKSFTAVLAELLEMNEKREKQ